MRNRTATPASLPVRAAASRGFSLLEMLVALIVVVLVTTLVNFTVNSGGQDVQLEATVRELADVASYALDEAQMTGVDYGLLVREEPEAGEVSYSYQWLEHHVDGWGDPVSGKEVFAQRKLPPGIALDLELDEALMKGPSLEDKEKHVDHEFDLDKDDEQPTRPQVVFYASGETTPGAINVRSTAKRGDLLWRVQWDLLGRFEVLRRGVADEEVEEEEH